MTLHIDVLVKDMPCSSDPDRWHNTNDPIAKWRCATQCPMRRQCAQDALNLLTRRPDAEMNKMPELGGIWGGIYIPPTDVSNPGMNLRRRRTALKQLEAVVQYAPDVVVRCA